MFYGNIISYKGKFCNIASPVKAQSRKYQGVFKVKIRVKSWQVRGIWSQQLEHKQVPKSGTEPAIAQSRAFPASRNKPLECITWADMSEF